jgi:IPT/TIG domain
MVRGGLFVDPNWTPRLADRLGSVRTDTMVHEHWAQDLAPVMYPHIPNGFWREVPLGEPPEPVLDPTIDSVSPTSGIVGAPLMITGANFDAGTGAFFGGFGQIMTWASVTGFTGTTLSLTVPPMGPGTYHVSVQEAPSGPASTLDNAFTVNVSPPTITGNCTPVSGPGDGGTVVLIPGTGFTGFTGVTIDGAPAANTSLVSDTQVRATIPQTVWAGNFPHSCAVVVQHPLGNASRTGGFLYMNPPSPTFTSIVPANGPEEGGTAVTVTGSGFSGLVPATGVMFGPTYATGVVPISATQFTCVSPPGVGVVDLSITSTNGTLIVPAAFTYDAGSDVQQVAQGAQDSAQTIGDAAQDIGDAAQDNGEAVQGTTEGSGTTDASGTTSEAPSASTDATEAPATGAEPDMTEYEMDQMWGIGTATEPVPSS